MKIYFGRFNTNLWLLIPALLVACKTTEESRRDKEASTLRLHLEVNQDGTERNKPIPIFRGNPVLVNVNSAPLLDEGSVAQAAVIDTTGGFAIQVQFDRHGTFVLVNTTTAYKGSRIAVFSEFGEARWLAAPRLTRPITDGTFSFAPDCSREEAERIVRGLNNVAKKLKKKIFFKESP